MAAALLFAIAAGTDVMSSFLGGYAADNEAKAEANMLKIKATIADQDATARLDKARFDSQRAARTGEGVLGELTAQLGASGARLDVGAPMALLAEQAGELELDQTLIFADAESDARRLRYHGQLFRTSAENAKRRGKNARRASLIFAFGKGAKAFAGGKQLFGGGGSVGGGGPGVVESRDFS